MLVFSHEWVRTGCWELAATKATGIYITLLCGALGGQREQAGLCPAHLPQDNLLETRQVRSVVAGFRGGFLPRPQSGQAAFLLPESRDGKETPTQLPQGPAYRPPSLPAPKTSCSL